MTSSSPKENFTLPTGLLGTAAQHLPLVIPHVMNNGHILNRNQQLALIKVVAKEEIFNAPKRINDNKAPGWDGFDAFFQESLVSDRRSGNSSSYGIFQYGVNVRNH